MRAPNDGTERHPKWGNAEWGQRCQHQRVLNVCVWFAARQTPVHHTSAFRRESPREVAYSISFVPRHAFIIILYQFNKISYAITVCRRANTCIDDAYGYECFEEFTTPCLIY